MRDFHLKIKEIFGVKINFKKQKEEYKEVVEFLQWLQFCATIKYTYKATRKYFKEFCKDKVKKHAAEILEPFKIKFSSSKKDKKDKKKKKDEDDTVTAPSQPSIFDTAPPEQQISKSCDCSGCFGSCSNGSNSPKLHRNSNSFFKKSEEDACKDCESLLYYICCCCVFEAILCGDCGGFD
uniref:Uncharacterized protein n=1 Tax=Meloidogyne hapla TaxID=6305 RepID=A0A1I8B1T8_MELHA